MTTLRPYQRLALRHVQQRLQDGYHRLYVSLPTGTGKSVLLAALAHRAVEKGRVLVLAHLQDLVTQLARTLSQEGLAVGMLMQGQRQLDCPVTVATPQSFLAMLPAFLEANPLPVATLFIDEAHHAVNGSVYEQILTALDANSIHEQVSAIGFTATPYRSDTRSMFSVLPTCAFIREIPEMIKDHWLAPLTWVPLHLDMDLSVFPTTAQMGELDYSKQALTQTLMQTALMEEMVRQVVPHLEHRPTLVFALSVEHAEHLAALFCQAGRVAVAVSGSTSQTLREHIYAEWRAGSIQIVCNCRLLTEGFDFPALAALVIARPTRSPGFYVQMLGRGMRKDPDKQDCLVIDVMGNNPDLSEQMVLPQVTGVSTPEEIHALTDTLAPSPRPSQALLKQMMGAEVQTGLSILDPFGASPLRWTSSRGGYFTRVSSDVVAILEPDKSGSGLYHSRLYTMKPGQEPIHQWIERNNLPLRQHVALANETISVLSHNPLGRKDASWLDEPATDKQRATLKSIYPKLTAQIDDAALTKGEVSDVITARRLSRTFYHPPSMNAKDGGAGDD